METAAGCVSNKSPAVHGALLRYDKRNVCEGDKRCRDTEKKRYFSNLSYDQVKLKGSTVK